MSQKWLIFNQNMEDSHPILSKWIHIDLSGLHFFLSDTFSQGNVCWWFSLMVMTKKSTNFLMKSVETPRQFSSLSSFKFNFMTRLYNFSITLILFSISKQNDFVQFDQQNRSFSTPQLVNFSFNKYSPPSEVMYFCESFWMIFQYLYTLFLIYISLL